MANTLVFVIHTASSNHQNGHSSHSHCHPIIQPHRTTSCFPLFFPWRCCWETSVFWWLEVFFQFPGAGLFTTISYSFLLVPRSFLFETALLPSGVSLKPFVQVSGCVGTCVCEHRLCKHYRELERPSFLHTKQMWKWGMSAHLDLSLLFLNNEKFSIGENPFSGALESPS